MRLAYNREMDDITSMYKTHSSNDTARFSLYTRLFIIFLITLITFNNGWTVCINSGACNLQFDSESAEETSTELCANNCCPAPDDRSSIPYDHCCLFVTADGIQPVDLTLCRTASDQSDPALHEAPLTDDIIYYSKIADSEHFYGVFEPPLCQSGLRAPPINS
ncbi:MAG: hypothetical protein SGI97_05135 [candidate division Zixibacteria bacterium]|nr:hypothetical protein [candidate division Zixibacteria bacterium]